LVLRGQFRNPDPFQGELTKIYHHHHPPAVNQEVMYPYKSLIPNPECGFRINLFLTIPSRTVPLVQHLNSTARTTFSYRKLSHSLFYKLYSLRRLRCISLSFAFKSSCPAFPHYFLPSSFSFDRLCCLFPQCHLF